MRPLDGVRVIEAANYVSGPFAGLLLAQLGAEVVKLEQPGVGDAFRKWRNGASSPTFGALNYGKQSVAVDLKSAAGQEVVRELLRDADVLVENFRPGVLERYGLGPDAVAALAPRLVYCSITGYGPDGPLAGEPGYDTVGQARSGLLSLLTDLDAPQPMGFSLSDHLTGVFAGLGIVAALRSREVTGRGTWVRTSLLEATVGLMAESFGRYLADGDVPRRGHRARLAQVFTVVAADGKAVAVHLSSPEKFWQGLASALERPDLLTDERFRDRPGRIEHYDALRAVISAVAGGLTRAELLARLAAHGVPCAAVQDLEEVAGDEQVRHLGLITETSGDRGSPVRHPRAPVTGTGWLDGPPLGDPPGLGDDTAAVLAAAGLTAERLASLTAAGVIAVR
ncbi:CoA transferase [Jiangella mangrovi]|uniref:Crotonobetainyl-CoA:carnitine CoA-transferase CaiB-like acyl-CoA transferase n=1 Tax=Jiangella mangrovi TaxID=1524084 RepID=A0A7W9LMS7_9ACTN|nr:crotonobetainyl-CoA:carnitine CoA-transferase CaiB-like acyl-CoA transferase [Jiangella mangrovi]